MKLTASLMILLLSLTSLSVIASESLQPLFIEGKLTVMSPDIIQVPDGAYKLAISHDCRFLRGCASPKFLFMSETSRIEIPLKLKTIIPDDEIRTFEYYGTNEELGSIVSLDSTLAVTFKVEHSHTEQKVLFKEVPKVCESKCTHTVDNCARRDFTGRCEDDTIGRDSYSCTNYETRCSAPYETCLLNTSSKVNLIGTIMDLKSNTLAAKFISEQRGYTKSETIPMARCFQK
jgi:hypothetical protein